VGTLAGEVRELRGVAKGVENDIKGAIDQDGHLIKSTKEEGAYSLSGTVRRGLFIKRPRKKTILPRARPKNGAHDIQTPIRLRRRKNVDRGQDKGFSRNERSNL